MCARLLAQRWTPGLLCWLGAAHSKGCGGAPTEAEREPSQHGGGTGIGEGKLG